MNLIHIVMTDENGNDPILLDSHTAASPLWDALRLSPPSPASVDEQLSGILLTLGIPANVKGYYYLCKSIKLIMQSPEYLKPITKRLYPEIAQRFSTTPEKVERCIRHAIKIAWQRGRVEQLNEQLGCVLVSRSDQPSNSELIALIAERLQQRVCAFGHSGV